MSVLTRQIGERQPDHVGGLQWLPGSDKALQAVCTASLLLFFIVSSLHNNRLPLLPESVLTGLTELASVSLQGNQMTALPDSLTDDLLVFRYLFVAFYEVDVDKVRRLGDNFLETLPTVRGLQLWEMFVCRSYCSSYCQLH
jgi:hypothetical protein